MQIWLTASKQYFYGPVVKIKVAVNIIPLVHICIFSTRYKAIDLYAYNNYVVIIIYMSLWGISLVSPALQNINVCICICTQV